MSRNNLILTGLIGLLGAVLLTALALLLMQANFIPILVSNSLYGWGLFLFLLFFSVVEIPVMILGMRRMAASSNPKAKYVTLAVNAGYVFFAAVYAIPFILLTGWLGWGVALAGLTVIRFVSSILFLPK
jgi:hypothetical protein